MPDLVERKISVRFFEAFIDDFKPRAREGKQQVYVLRGTPQISNR